ncbi:MAG: gamma-glutamyltransferase [Candidatus Binataceae bacterium]|nr:gamma-glutamyltransferase [Candidatus Binataceae bacterium]
MLNSSGPGGRRAISFNVFFVGGAVFAALLSVIALTQIAFPAPARHAMVVAENELAARAGMEILQHGGNAIDAACATALAVGVTNPGSCGIGGGGFMLIYVARTGQFFALDYRERAPFRASADMFLRNGHADEELARTGPLAVAVPGEIAGIEAALTRFGTMKFSAVAAPAIKLARDGFPLGDHMAAEIAHVAPKLARDPGLRAVFLNSDNSPPKPGQTISNKELAATLTRLGDQPAKNFYHGAIAHQIATFLQDKDGLLSAADLAQYQPVWRKPLNFPFQGYEVYTMPPPSSGGIVLEMLGMLEPGHLQGLGLNSPPYLARLIEVMRKGFIDRDAYGDPAYVHVPIATLLSPTHINEARRRAMHHNQPAIKPGVAAHDHGTSNLCVVDAEGNVVALTTTINTAFGAKLMIPQLGIILNNEMDDFGVAPGVSNVYGLVGERANAIAPGKRPLSSMAPSIVTRYGRPVLALGGSGGPTIITGVLQVALEVLDFHLRPTQAVDEPRIHDQGMPDVAMVENSMPDATVKGLQGMGYKVKVLRWFGAVNAIQISPEGRLRGAFDPRKDGGLASY